MAKNKCRICGCIGLDAQFCWEDFPVYIWPFDKARKQSYERLRVYRCPDCGLVQLDRFDDDFIRRLYSQEVFGLVSAGEFKTTLVKNNEFLQYCIAVFGDNWSRGKKILDVGGHDVLTCYALDFQEGAICDPNAPEGKVKDNIKIYRESFSRTIFEKCYFDVIILKHVVEHINDLAGFMDDIRYVLKEEGKIIIEVPDLMQGLIKGYYALFYHQHLMYFDRYSLSNLLRRFGFEIIQFGVYGNNLRVAVQKCCLKAAGLAWEKGGAIPEMMRKYLNSLEVYFESLARFLKQNQTGQKDICYGVGGGTTILFHMCKPLRDRIECVVDSSSAKIGKKVGGTDFVVQPPKVLGAFSNRNIIINSEDFFEEIRDQVKQEYPKHNFSYLRIMPKFEKEV